MPCPEPVMCASDDMARAPQSPRRETLIGFAACVDLPLPGGLLALDLGPVRALIHPRHPLSQADRIELACRCHDMFTCFLPLSAGTLTRPQIRAYHDANRAAIGAAMHTVCGKQEIVLTLRMPGAAPIPAKAASDSGKSWLRARRQDLHTAQARGTAALTALTGIVHDAGLADAKQRPDQQPWGADLSLLVPRDQLADIRAALARAAKGRALAPDAECRLTGPWPPFSFVHLPGLRAPAGEA